MKLLIQFIVFAICYCLNAYAAPFFKDLGFALGILVFGDQDGGAILCGLLAGALAVLVYGAGFAVSKRINERRLDGSLKNAPGIKRTIFALPLLLADAAITGSAGTQAPFFGSGDFVVPASGAQLFHDLLFLSTFHWMGVLGLVPLIWGLVAFFRRKVAAPKPAPSKFTEEAAPAPVQPSAAPKPKAGFCKLCGDPIDPVTRKCTGCKKQYFRLPTFTDKHWFVAALAVACAVILFLLFVLAARSNQVAELAATVTDLESKLTAAEQDASYQKQKAETNKSQLDGLRRANEELRNKVSDMEEKVLFFDRHAVFVLDDGSKEYHTYDCAWRKYSGLSFWIYNTEAAESKGYKPHFCCD